MKKLLALALVALMALALVVPAASADPMIPYTGENHITFADGENFETDDNQLLIWFRPQVIDALRQDGATLDVLNIIAEQQGVDLLIANQTDSKDNFYTLKIQEGAKMDYYEHYGSLGVYTQQIADGVLEPISVDMIKECMPNYVKWIEGYVGPNVWDMLSVDGKLYALPNIWSLGANAMGLGVREDLLTTAGATVPTTIAEWETAMEKLKAAGLIPFSSSKDIGIQNSLNWIFGAYNSYPTIFHEKDGKIVYGSIEPEAKEPLRIAADWYAKGYIDNEYATIDDAANQQKWNDSKSASTLFYFYCFYPKGAHLGDDYYRVVYNTPGAIVNHIALPKGPEGFSGTAQNPSIGAGNRFAAGTSAEKIEKYLKFWDYCSMTQEGIKMFMAGIEGETYNMVDGKVQFVEGLADELNEDGSIKVDHKADRQKLGIECDFNCIPVSLNNYDLQYWNLDPAYTQARIDAPLKNPGLYDVMKTFPRPVWEQYKDALTKLQEDFYYAVFTGAKTVDDFDAFVAEWLAAGGQEVLDEANALWAASK